MDYVNFIPEIDIHTHNIDYVEKKYGSRDLLFVNEKNHITRLSG